MSILIVDIDKLPKNWSAYSPKKQLNFVFNMKQPIHIIPATNYYNVEKEILSNCDKGVVEE